MKSLVSVSVVIPTYNREEVLIQTLDELLKLQHKALEILVVDQSERHGESVTERLSSMHDIGDIRWLKLATPSIPKAMNIGALKARGDIVLFVDDDILTRSELILEHAKAYLDSSVHSIAGQVIQSWEEELTPKDGSYLDNNTQDPDAFMFNSANPMPVRRFIGCNISFKRTDLLDIGGFDNNFAKVAYRYEAEAAERFASSGRTMLFEPKASIQHLKEESGGTRSYGNHLRSLNPAHTVGMYYYFLVIKNQHKRWTRFFSSPFASCVTRFHLKHPWYIPITFMSHVSGMAWAVLLKIQGQKLITPSTIKHHEAEILQGD